MKKLNVRGALYCAIITVLLISFAVFAGCDGERTDKAPIEQGGVKMEGEIPEPVAGVNVFPSVLEDFDLTDFTADFFESNTLILVPFGWGHSLLDNLRFYTVFFENGKLNFLIEIPNPDTGGDCAFDYRIFAVIIPNQVLSKYEIGGSKVFKAYEFHAGEWNSYSTTNCREWLKEVEKNSVGHRVSYVWRGLSFDCTMHLKFLSRIDWWANINEDGSANDILVISSVESLQELFNVSPAE